MDTSWISVTCAVRNSGHKLQTGLDNLTALQYSWIPKIMHSCTCTVPCLLQLLSSYGILSDVSAGASLRKD